MAEWVDDSLVGRLKKAQLESLKSITMEQLGIGDHLRPQENKIISDELVSRHIIRYSNDV